MTDETFQSFYLSGCSQQNQFKLMLSKSKVVPIHCNYQDKGRRAVLNENVKRNSSCYTSGNTRAIIDSTRKSTNLPQRKPQSAIVNVRNSLTTPTHFLTSYNPFEQSPNTYNQQVPRVIATAARRKSSYLSRRFIHKKLLESYLDNVFQKVSLIRATEERPRSSYRRVHLSLNHTTR